MIKSKVAEMLGLEYPIFQGGMAWVATAELVSAVSNAGGLGIIGAGSMDGEILIREIKKARELTEKGKPFGVNLMLLNPFIDDLVDIVIKERVDVVTTGAGNPGKYIDRFKEAGIKVFPIAPAVALAKRLERLGVDGIIVEGGEAGGHVGELTTIVLTPLIVDNVSLPVIAAGGIADGRGIVAALALGADAVQIGTRFVVSKECIAHENYKNAVIRANARDAVVSGRSTGHPVRCMKNKLTREFDKLEKSGAPKEKLEELGSGKLRAAVVEGDTSWGSVMMGQSAGLVREEQSVKEILEEIFSEAETLIKELPNRLTIKN
jgi:enoyl-[acyl-carrier protein] reductase II